MRFLKVVILFALAVSFDCGLAIGDTSQKGVGDAMRQTPHAESAQNANENKTSAAQENSDADVRCFWEKNQNTIVILFAGLMLITTVSAFYLAMSRRMLHRSMALYASIPARIGACARDGSILFLRDDSINDPDSIEKLSQLPNIDTKLIRQMFNTVFNTRQEQTFDYEYKNAKRSMTIAPLASEIFGKEAVIWISHDNSELQNTRNEAKNFADQSRQNLAKFKRATHLIDILINGLPCHIFAKNPDNGFKYVFINNSVANFLEIKTSDAIGNDDFGIFEQHIAQTVRENDIELLSGNRESMTYVLKILSPRGKSVDMRVTTFPFVDDNGQKLIIGAAFDISEMLEQKKAEQPAEC